MGDTAFADTGAAAGVATAAGTLGANPGTCTGAGADTAVLMGVMFADAFDPRL